MSSSTGRERIVRWEDPAPTLNAVGTKAGVDVLRAMQAGEIAPPPVAMLVGFRFESVEPGKVVMSLVPDEVHYNPLGMVHGGITATLLDTVMGCSVHSTLAAGRGYTTLSISVNYIRAITTATGRITATGTVEHAGRSTAIARGVVHDSKGRLMASAETTCMLFDAPTTPKG
jgi:uncharacterized protein (TIGR00369 family)